MSEQTPLQQILETQLTRRTVLGGLAAAAVRALASPSGASQASAASIPAAPPLVFEEVQHGIDPFMHAPKDYQAQVVVRWGDPVLPGAPAFDPSRQTAAAQAAQFGYNNDFVAFMPLPPGSHNSEHGLLCVNHEYTIPHLMFPGVAPADKPLLPADKVAIEMAAHGMSVVEIERDKGTWRLVLNGKYNRRITAGATPFQIADPAAGHERLKTAADPTGRKAIGTINNCAGGVTPWGTVLSGEENFPYYFGGQFDDSHPEAANYKAYGITPTGNEYAWLHHDPRFDVSQHPHEPNRFGWVVEIDPYDPQSTPIKRTALGRLRHEGAATSLTANGRLVAYTGDDEKFQHLYKYVSDGVYNPTDRAANLELLDKGILYVAHFNADGWLDWLPLTHGNGPLTAANGFHSQADVLIETRRAAKLLGGTPMDRPEDVEANPVTGHVFVMLTNNVDRLDSNPANPRTNNRNGHVIELIHETAGGGIDQGALRARWRIFLLAGNPANPDDSAAYDPAVSENGWLTCPDNCAFDPLGRMVICTDGAPDTYGMADGVYVCETDGLGKALTRMFFRGPTGCEICGPAFTPDGGTLFLSVQHPGDDPDSTYAAPTTRWPDFNNQIPPRPSIVAISRRES